MLIHQYDHCRDALILDEGHTFIESKQLCSISYLEGNICTNIMLCSIEASDIFNTTSNHICSISMNNVVGIMTSQA